MEKNRAGNLNSGELAFYFLVVSSFVSELIFCQTYGGYWIESVYIAIRLRFQHPESSSVTSFVHHYIHLREREAGNPNLVFNLLQYNIELISMIFPRLICYSYIHLLIPLPNMLKKKQRR